MESDKFKLKKLDPPFIYAENGVFEIGLAELTDGKIDISLFGIEGDMPVVDWYVIFFPNKVKQSETSSNLVVVRNDKSFKKHWDDAREFAKTIKKGMWVELNKTKDGKS